MELRCKASKRFLLEINIEEYYNNLKKMGIFRIPLSFCIFDKVFLFLMELLYLYPSHYTHIKSYKRES